MSRFSGKFDVYDSVYGMTDEEIANTEFYIGDIPTRLMILSRKDLIPYYGHIACIVTGNKRNITRSSYIDEHEQEMLGWYLRDCLKVYRKCKRKKEEFTFDRFIEDSFWSKSNDVRAKLEIFERVKEKGERAAVSNIKIDSLESYRESLYNEMIANGWDDRESYYWVYKQWKKYEGD